MFHPPVVHYAPSDVDMRPQLEYCCINTAETIEYMCCQKEHDKPCLAGGTVSKSPALGIKRSKV